MMIAQVEVTNTLNLSTIIAISAVFFAASAYVVPKLFKLAQQIIKEILDLKVWMAEYQAKLTMDQTVRLEACIHQIPGHPENPTTSAATGATAPADPPAEQ